MTFVGDVLPIIGTLIGVAGTVATGVAQRNQGNYQNQIAQRNAEIANQNAVKTINVAQENQEASDNETAALVGEQLSNQGASGLAATSRSFVLTRKRAKELGTLDALRIRQQGEEGAAQYRQQATNYLNEGEMAKTAGQNAFTGSLISAGGSLVGAATSTNFSKFGSANTNTALKTKDPWVTGQGLSLRRKTI